MPITASVNATAAKIPSSSMFNRRSETESVTTASIVLTSKTGCAGSISLRQVVDHAGGWRAWQRPNAIRQPLIEVRRRLHIRVFRFRQRQTHRQNLLGLEAEVGFVKPDEAFDQ